MSTIPTLTGCGRPATRRVEIYSTRGRTSLDGAVYTCTDHLRPAIDAARAGGFTAYSAPLVGEPPRCGSGADYTGATLRVWQGPEPEQPPPACRARTGARPTTPTPTAPTWRG